MIAAGLVYAALPSCLSVGPDWLLLAILMGALVQPGIIIEEHHGELFLWLPQINLRQVLRDRTEDQRR